MLNHCGATLVHGSGRSQQAVLLAMQTGIYTPRSLEFDRSIVQKKVAEQHFGWLEEQLPPRPKRRAASTEAETYHQGVHPWDTEPPTIDAAWAKELLQQCQRNAVELQSWVCVDSSTSKIPNPPPERSSITERTLGPCE